jgi:hypothetical protein
MPTAAVGMAPDVHTAPNVRISQNAHMASSAVRYSTPPRNFRRNSQVAVFRNIYQTSPLSQYFRVA